MEYEMNPIFKSYREYVAGCVASGAEPPKITEFTSSQEPFKVDDVTGPEFEIDTTPILEMDEVSQ